MAFDAQQKQAFLEKINELITGYQNYLESLKNISLSPCIAAEQKKVTDTLEKLRVDKNYLELLTNLETVVLKDLQTMKNDYHHARYYLLINYVKNKFSHQHLQGFRDFLEKNAPQVTAFLAHFCGVSFDLKNRTVIDNIKLSLLQHEGKFFLITPFFLTTPTHRSAIKIVLPVFNTADSYLIECSKPWLMKVNYYTHIYPNFPIAQAMHADIYGKETLVPFKTLHPFGFEKIRTIMPLLEGENLNDFFWRHVVKEEGAYKYVLPLNCALSILLNIAVALEKFHEKRWVHADLKKENILLQQDKIVIIDTDNAQEEGLFSTKNQLGTGGYVDVYIANNLHKEFQATSTVDIYAFGVIIGEFLTGAYIMADEVYDIINNENTLFLHFKNAIEKMPERYGVLQGEILCLLNHILNKRGQYRPTIIDIKEALRGFQKKMPIFDPVRPIYEKFLTPDVILSKSISPPLPEISSINSRTALLPQDSPTRECCCIIS